MARAATSDCRCGRDRRRRRRGDACVRPGAAGGGSRRASRSRGAAAAGDARARPGRRSQRAGRAARRYRRRRGRDLRRRPSPDAHPLRRLAWLQDRGGDHLGRGCRAASRSWCSRSAATAPTRCSNSKAASIGCSASRRPSLRGGSTPPRRRSRCCRAGGCGCQVEQSDLRIDVYRAGGHGGQSVNTTDSAVRITHLPTMTVVTCQDERSQLQKQGAGDEDSACAAVRAGAWSGSRAEEAEARSSQIGTGERSEKIRTYNFPQNRVTDHRIGLTTHNLDRVLAGDLTEFTEALQADEKRQKAGRRRRGMTSLGEVITSSTGALSDTAQPSAGRRAAYRARPLAVAQRAVFPARPGTDVLRAGIDRVAGGAPQPARAGRLHPRPVGLSRSRPRGRPAGADPPAGDRGAGGCVPGVLGAVPPSVPAVLDVGTGSGAIALAIAEELPAALVAAADISPAALELARANGADLGLDVDGWSQTCWLRWPGSGSI